MPAILKPPLKADAQAMAIGGLTQRPLRRRSFEAAIIYLHIMHTNEITIRVRYAETDRMGLLHHANYLVFFEEGRTELLRSMGYTYRDLEDKGYLLVLTRIAVRYRQPARYDDVLTLRTIVDRVTNVKIEHRYELFRDEQLITEGESTLACVDRDGKVQALPDELRATKSP